VYLCVRFLHFLDAQKLTISLKHVAFIDDVIKLHVSVFLNYTFGTEFELQIEN
jgi:hypothetical protein